MNHISDDLPRLLTGDAGRDEVMAAAQHLRGCPDCQQELVSAVVAHASLTSAHRFAPEIVAPGTTAVVEQPQTATLPDLSAMFTKVREEASAETTRPHHRRRLIAAAAAAIVLAGGGIAIAETAGSGSSQPASHHIALSAYGQGTVPGTATLVGADRVRLDAASLPKLDAEHRYEVWLTNAQRTKMQPIGWLGATGAADMRVPTDLLSTYSAIEVSVQQLDAAYTYSGDSVLRGSYS